MKAFFKYLSVVVYFAVVIFNVLPASSMSGNRSTYSPPKGKVRRQPRTAGGSRGCTQSLNHTVILLVPQDHTATTVSERPIFFWYLSQKLSSPLRFTLLEPGKKPIFIEEFTPEPGIVAFKLPENSSPLEIGKIYRWTVTVVCNEKKPSRNLFAQAWIERIPPLISNKFSENTNDTSFCSIEYAKVGIWYDALACNYMMIVQNQNHLNSDSQEFWSLLEQINLPNLVRQKPTFNFY